MIIPKALANDFEGRFREIISDPINILIERVPEAGLLDGDQVVLHNGNRVAIAGEFAYYDGFSRVLIFNRGVHEPLEEYCFQQVLKNIGDAPKMIELGSYWAHYSMWLKRNFSNSNVLMVEPEAQNIVTGKINFERNGFEGEFMQDFVGRDGFRVDELFRSRGVDYIDILHADIQGYELEMLEGAEKALIDRSIGYFFVSTHSQELHGSVVSIFRNAGYRIEISSDYDSHTTAYDGLVVAAHPNFAPIIRGAAPLGRNEICQAHSRDLLASLNSRLLLG
jgi:hypothetical protein